MTQVLILMGSDSDAAVMPAAGDVSTELGVTSEDDGGVRASVARARVATG